MEKASKGFFFPPLSFSALCKYEYGKECQDVLEEAVYITQVEDYFLEVHFLMTACGVVCVCFAYGGDKTGDAVCVCVVGIFSVTWMTRIVAAAGVTSLFQQLSGFVFPPPVSCRATTAY